MKPAAPLPWRDFVEREMLCLQDAEGNDLIGHVDLPDYGDDAPRERQNVAYMAHAANAYPKLVERHQTKLAALRKVDEALQEMGHYALGKVLREEMSATQALLRELGEVS